MTVQKRRGIDLDLGLKFSVKLKEKRYMLLFHFTEHPVYHLSRAGMLI